MLLALFEGPKRSRFAFQTISLDALKMIFTEDSCGIQQERLPESHVES